MKILRILPLVALTLIVGCSSSKVQNHHVKNNVHLVSAKPAGEKLSTIEYYVGSKKIGAKRLLAILKSKAAVRYPNQDLALFNLQIIDNETGNHATEQLRQRRSNCNSGLGRHQSINVVDKGDAYQIHRPTSRCTSHHSRVNRKRIVASVEIYQGNAP